MSDFGEGLVGPLLLLLLSLSLSSLVDDNDDDDIGNARDDEV